MATASESTEGLEIGPLREDERFGKYIYRHEIVHGVSFPPGITERKMDMIKQDWVSRPEDVYIVTFPKSGTTWTQQVVHLLHTGGVQGNVPIIRAIPWFERVIAAEGSHGLHFLNSLPNPRFFKSHTPVQLFPQSGGSPKFIFVVRNPKDTMVSMFHHAKSKIEFEFEGDWNTWYNIFVRGLCESGDWFSFTLDWYQRCKVDPSHNLLLSFEDMKTNPGAAIRAIAAFINISCDDDLVNRIAEMSSFDVMKTNDLTNCSQIPQRGMPHLRKGEVGDWRNYFTIAQNDAFDELIRERMGDSGLHLEYLPK